MRMFIAAAALVVATGCKKEEESTELSAQDAQVVYGANAFIIQDVMGQVSNEIAAAGKALTVSPEGNGYSISGSVDGGTGWTGTVTATGYVEYTDSTYIYDLDIEYQEVNYAGGDITFNGSLGSSIEMTTSEDGSYDYYYAMDGSIDVTGAVEGSVDMNYSLTIAYDAATGAVTYAAEGTIGGQDVSGYGGY